MEGFLTAANHFLVENSFARQNEAGRICQCRLSLLKLRMQPQRINDVICCGGHRHLPGGALHSLEPRRIVKQAVDLVSEDRKIVAPNRNSLL